MTAHTRIQTIVGHTLASVCLLTLSSACSKEEPSAPSGDRNLPPVVESIPDFSLSVGDTLSFLTVASDPEGKPLTYRLVVAHSPGSGSARASVDPDSGEFIFVAQKTDRPFRWVGIFVADPEGEESYADFYVAVDHP